MVAPIGRRPRASASPYGPTAVPPKPEQGRGHAAGDVLHVRRLLAHIWQTAQMVGQTAFLEQRCPATGTTVGECPGCRGPRLPEAPRKGALPHLPAVLAYLEEQVRGMRDLLDLHQHIGGQAE